MTGEDLDFVPEDLREELTHRQLLVLGIGLRQYWEWLRVVGKNPDRKVGFAPSSVHEQFHRTLQFIRWAWQQNSGYLAVTRIPQTYADRYEKALDKDEICDQKGNSYSLGSKRKLQQAVKKFFSFRAYRYGSKPWTPNLSFSQTEYAQADYFTIEERGQLFEASLMYGDLGKYNNLSPEARDRRKSLLAQKLGKPKSAITPDDFQSERTSWKIPSLVSVSLDLGARPSFIERCLFEWYEPKPGIFRIPKEEAPKNDAYWEPSLSTRSIEMLNRWRPQRGSIPAYDDSSVIWLNREGNSYNSSSLNYLLQKLIEEADIDQSGRKLVWTSIRRSTGTYLTYLQSLAYAKQQLRHKSLQSTLKYVEIPVEARQNALDQMIGASTDLGLAESDDESSDPLEVLQCF